MLKKCVGTKDVRDEKDGKLGVRGARHVAAEATELFNMATSGAWIQGWWVGTTLRACHSFPSIKHKHNQRNSLTLFIFVQLDCWIFSIRPDKKLWFGLKVCVISYLTIFLYIYFSKKKKKTIFIIVANKKK